MAETGMTAEAMTALRNKRPHNNTALALPYKLQGKNWGIEIPTSFVTNQSTMQLCGANRQTTIGKCTKSLKLMLNEGLLDLLNSVTG